MAKKFPRRKRPSDEHPEDQPSNDGTERDLNEDTSDSQSTFIPEGKDASGSGDDPDATVQLDSTVMMSGQEESSDSSSPFSDSSLDDDDTSPESDDSGHVSTFIPADKTVGNIDQTVDIDPRELEDTQDLDEDPESPHRTVVSHGRGTKTEPDLSAAGDPNSTTGFESEDDLEQTIQSETVGVDSASDSQIGDGTVGDETKATSLMMSKKIGATINPRELTGKDAEFWGSMTMDGSGDGLSVLPPAIDRSLTETKLQIRGRHVVTPRSDPTEPSDYRLMRLLGKGGMGNVYVAKQGSLDRIIAVKVIKPLTRDKKKALRQKGKLDQVEQERRQQFVAEAVVTSDLDHPNIVPIHDIAVTSDNTLFYSMKRVSGEPWSKTLKHTSLDENLDILLKVSDAIALAHDRGVVHRDIKPENIMVGDYGVVMVMDWGLALAIPKGHFDRDKSIYASSGLGGTPAFMAPEMAIGPIERIGPGADIYLLGATLFMIVTGKAPHQAGNVSQCLKAVAKNEIRPVSDKYHGELLNIALKAMETRPEDRYADVGSFQTAIREYRSHAESISLAIRAAEDLQLAKQDQSYVKFSSATFRFEEAVELWDSNEPAVVGLAETRVAHADAAYENGDYDLGLSLLDQQVPEHQPIIQKLQAGIDERDSRQTKLKVLRMAAAAMLAFILIGGTVALYLINTAKNDAVTARVTAETARDAEKDAKNKERIAKEEERKAKDTAIVLKDEAIVLKDEAIVLKDTAVMAQKDAEKARDDAKAAQMETETANKNLATANNDLEVARDKETVAKEDAIEQKRKAERATEIAQYEQYVSKVGLAKARIERNDFDGARELLIEIQNIQNKQGFGFEWNNIKSSFEKRSGQDLSPRVLKNDVQTLFKKATQSIGQKTQDAVLSLAVDQSGRSAIATLRDGTVELLLLNDNGEVTARGNKKLASEATAATIDSRNNQIAIGLKGGDIHIYDARLANLQRTLTGHDRDINDLEFTPSGLLVSASDDRTARVWDPVDGELTTCWHITPVSDVDVVERSDVLLLATASADNKSGRVVVWNVPCRGTAQVKAQRVGEFLGHDNPVTAVALAPDGRTVASGDLAGTVFLWESRSVRQLDYESEIASALTSLQPNSRSVQAPPRKSIKANRLVDRKRFGSELAHANAVRSIQFSGDGKLLTGSDDYTLKVWEVESRSLAKTLRGHGGWVIAAEFLPQNSKVVVSASNDASIRRWLPDTFIEDIPEAPRVSGSLPLQLKGYIANAHDDEIWSAQLSRVGEAGDQNNPLRIVTGSRDHTARILELDDTTLTFKEVAQLSADDRLAEGTPYVGMSMVVDERRRRIFVGSADSTVRIWDLDRAAQIGEASETGLNLSLAVSQSGRLMLTGSSRRNAKAILWQVDPQGDASPRIAHPLQGHKVAVTALAISPDESLLFTGDRIGRGILWNAKTGKQTGAPIDTVRGVRINAASFSIDGKELFIAADDQQLTRVDVRTGKTIKQYPHDGFVTQLSLSADGKFALTVSEEISVEFTTTATLWEIASGKKRVLDRVDSPRTEGNRSAGGGRERITSARFGVDAEYPVAMVGRSAAGGKSSRIQIWDVGRRVADAKVLESFRLPSKLPSVTAAIPAAGRKMLTLCGDAAFQWSLSSKKHEKSYRHHAALTQADFSFDGKYVVTGSRSVKIWDSTNGKSLCKLEVPHEKSAVWAVEFSPAADSGYLFATGGKDGFAKTWKWDPVSRTIEAVAQYELGETVQAVCFSRDGDKLLAVGDNGSARLWHVDQPNAQPTDFQVETAPQQNGQDAPEEVERRIVNFTCCAFSDDGESIVVGGDDKMARMWQIGQPAEPTVFRGHADKIEDVALLEGGGPRRVLTASRDRSARIWDPNGVTDNGTRYGREIVSLRRHTRGVTAIDVTADARLVMTASRDGKVILWPAE